MKTNIEYFDSHAHYDDNVFNEDRQQVIENAYNMGVTKIMDVGYNIETSNHAIQMSKKFEYVYASVGMHPEYCNNTIDIEKIYNLAKNNDIKAIGEIGLDYHFEHDKKMQQLNFIKQIDIANDLKLPVIIHSRDADMDMLKLLKNEKKPSEGYIMHCFSSSLEIAKQILKLGNVYISLSGTVTFKNAENLHKVAKYVPQDRLLIETDCPYLSPEPYRGKRNDSSKVIIVAEKIANLKNVTQEEIAFNTYKNACEIYKV